jgi:hypothetical protein
MVDCCVDGKSQCVCVCVCVCVCIDTFIMLIVRLS